MRPHTHITALVPIKARRHCKTRLAIQLSPFQRQQLARRMLLHVVNCLRSVVRIDRVVVLSPERDQLPDDVEWLADDGRNLNSSLEYALTTMRQQGADKVLIVPADLADLTHSDIDALLQGAESADVVIAPSKDGEGTNALLMSAVLPFQCQFGTQSFRAHCQQAIARGWRCTIVRREGLGFDVDTVDQLSRCRQFLPLIPSADVLEYRV